MLPSGGSLCHCYRGVGAIQISAFLHASQNHRTDPRSALRGIWAPVCADSGRKWSRFIAVHSSLQIQSPDAAKNESGFSDSPIRIWRRRSIRWFFFFFFWRFKFIWHARVYLWGHEKLLARDAGVSFSHRDGRDHRQKLPFIVAKTTNRPVLKIDSFSK